MATDSRNQPAFSVPAPVAHFFALFPLHTYPEIPISPRQLIKTPTLWLAPPQSGSESEILSSDVECLKWQAYLAFRVLEQKRLSLLLRYDISADGSLGGRLPNLHVPLPKDHALSGTAGARDGELIEAANIPAWVDSQLNVEAGQDEEGYKDERTREESRTWVSLLEKEVHNSFVQSQNPPPMLPSFESVTSLLPYSWDFNIMGYNVHAPRQTETPVSPEAYYKAIDSLSERLATDKWFLGSDAPTPLDAVLFAYLHAILHTHPKNSKREYVRKQVTKCVNLVAWERRVRGVVRSAWTNSR